MWTHALMLLRLMHESVSLNLIETTIYILIITYFSCHVYQWILCERFKNQNVSFVVTAVHSNRVYCSSFTIKTTYWHKKSVFSLPHMFFTALGLKLVTSHLPRINFREVSANQCLCNRLELSPSQPEIGK